MMIKINNNNNNNKKKKKKKNDYNNNLNYCQPYYKYTVLKEIFLERFLKYWQLRNYIIYC